MGKPKSNYGRKSKNAAHSVYNSKLPKINRFINIYQSNGNKSTKRSNAGIKQRLADHLTSQKPNEVSIQPIKVDEGVPVEIEFDDKSPESSLDVIAISSDVINKIDQVDSGQVSIDQKSKFHVNSVQNDIKREVNSKSSKNTDRVHTITPD